MFGGRCAASEHHPTSGFGTLGQFRTTMIPFSCHPLTLTIIIFCYTYKLLWVAVRTLSSTDIILACQEFHIPTQYLLMHCYMIRSNEVAHQTLQQTDCIKFLGNHQVIARVLT